MSERVREYAQDQLEVLFEDAGEHQLKNIAGPVRAYHVQILAFTHNIATPATRAVASAGPTPGISSSSLLCWAGAKR